MKREWHYKQIIFNNILSKVLDEVWSKRRKMGLSIDEKIEFDVDAFIDSSIREEVRSHITNIFVPIQRYMEETE